MPEEMHMNERHEELEFEHSDLSPSAIIAFLIGLAVFGVVVHFVISGMLRYMDRTEQVRQTKLGPMMPSLRPTQPDTRSVKPQDIKQFPEPRLEGNERIEINSFRLNEDKLLNSYGYVDQQRGVVRIPIDRAMRLIAQRGLPTRPQAGSVPPSPVNLGRQAAQRSDTSQRQKKQ
jgi:hypothetical protein